MFKINKKTEYALIALRHISQKPEEELTSAKEISESFHTPFDATSRVLQLMANAGWLRSEQGAYGGYKVDRPLSQMSMKTLCEIIEGPQAIVKCLNGESGSKNCDLVSTCNMISPLRELNQKLVGFLDQVMVQDLLGEEKSESLWSTEIRYLHGSPK